MGGKQRIMALYQTQPDHTLRAKALAKEYGIGGHSHDFLDGSRGFANHDGRGMEFDHYPDHQKITLKWTQVEKYIDLLIQSDRYLTDKEKEHYSPPVPVTVEPDATLTHAKNLIREFCQEEYDSEPDFSDLSKIGIAYTHATDEEIPIQVNVDLVGYRVERYLGDILVDERQHESLEDLTETELEALDFSELVSVTDEELEHYYSMAEGRPELSDEELDELPISAVMDGKVQTFPDAAALEEALNAEPAPEPAGNFRITDDHLGEGGAKQKYARNIEAIRTLFKLEQEHRGATAEEQQVLSQYVGWGGLADAFDPDKDNWTKEYAELKGLLSEDEYAAVRSSTLNAHYTSPVVIRSIYEAVEKMGFKSGNILEPSMGVGNFFGMLPTSMADSRLYGVELDSITGRIAKKLYPQADITVAGFETTDRRDFYDLVVGNIPFGQYRVNDKAYNKLGLSIHNYFVVKAIDQVRPGGVVAFVTSRYTMDSKDSTARKHMAERFAGCHSSAQ